MLIERIMRVLRLDASVFAEVENDQNATTEAAIVVALVALAGAVSGIIATLIGGGGFMAIIGQVLLALLGAFLGWVVWAAVTYFVGTSLFSGEADLNEMLRVIGYAQAPRLLGLLGFIPCAGWLIALLGWLASVYTGFLAIQEGLDLDTGQTLITVVIGFVVAFVVNLILGFIIGMILGVGAMGMGMLSGGLGEGGWLLLL